ncbi:Uu.00g090500.m01.CDS01 [Anthostomella pinea]|uniref:Dipeptidase n=1 Tax=Anthostomella pinea TaxID=933095 RepID=A0AAI8VMY2_9PEZI|nr:Uu.00g090500.m01.CDS01 [Anthostomella pinea]
MFSEPAAAFHVQLYRLTILFPLHFYTTRRQSTTTGETGSTAHKMDDKAEMGEKACLEVEVEPTETTPRKPSFPKAVVTFLCLFFFISVLHPAMRPYHPLSRGYAHVCPKSVEGRVQRILSETPLIGTHIPSPAAIPTMRDRVLTIAADGHNDLAIFIRLFYNNHIYQKNFTEPFEEGGMAMHVDLPRLREGLNGGAFWSVFTPCPANGSDYSDENYASSVQLTLQQIDLMTRLQAAYPNDFSGIVDSKSAVAAFKEGKLISPLGIEGLHQIGNSVANLRRFHAMGVRYATLTHNCGNIFADAAIWERPFGKAPAYWGGVSLKGRQLVNEMNRIGMIVDLSHVSVDTMVDVLGGREEWAGSKAPIMFSHSSAYALCPHPRNAPDHVLELVKKTNSVIMVNFSPDFVSCVDKGNKNGIPDLFPENNTLSHVVDHITYIGNLIGYDHVGLGSDFDGIMSTPEGLDDVSKYPDLIAELLKRGVSDKDAAKIAGGNILRVWGDVEKVAAKMQADGEPVMEDDLPNLFPDDLLLG